MDYAKFLIDDKYHIGCVIYRFKNKVNGKVYIGQTSTSLHNRVVQHMTNSRPNTKAHKAYFQKALNKYGIQNFDLDIIEICANKEELDERERYWIAYYNSTNKQFGYNIDSGGSKGKKTKGLSPEHKQALLMANLGKPRSESTKQKLREIHKQKWQDPVFKQKHIKNFEKLMGWNKVSVYQYDLNGQFVKRWNSIADVTTVLYGSKRKGSLKRNIINNNKKNKLGFMKNGSIWSFTPPSERRAY